MKKITIEYEVYQFNELDESIKRKLIDDEKQALKEDMIEFTLLDCMEEKAAELLEKELSEFKISDIKVYYDLSYSQGSGAMIQFIGYSDTHILRVKQSGLYYHERSFTFTYEYAENYEEVNEEDEKIMEDRITSINKKLSKYGYDFIEEDYEDEIAIERLSENEYTKNGHIFS